MAARAFGSQSMVATLRRVLVRRPDAAFAVADPAAWGYTSRPDLAAAQAEHDALVALLEESGVEVLSHTVPQPRRADSVFVFDPVLMTEKGAVVLRPGKASRRGEELALARRLEELGVPLLFALDGDERAEGGDLLWLDRRTLVAGRSLRTNGAGLEQLREGLAPHGIELLSVDLPYHRGPGSCLHLLSLLSLVDDGLAVIYPPLVPVPLWLELERRGFDLVEVPAAEFATQGSNVLALGPRRCLLLEENKITASRLAALGCEVVTYRGRELSHKAEGGPTCLTLPLLREGSA